MKKTKWKIEKRSAPVKNVQIEFNAFIVDNKIFLQKIIIIENSYLAIFIRFSGFNMQSFAIGKLDVVSITFVGSTFSVNSYTTPESQVTLQVRTLYFTNTIAIEKI